MRELPARPSLRVRLAVAFVGVAVVAVAAVAIVIVLIARSETGALSASDRARTADEVARVLADAYRRAGSWSAADSSGAAALASGADAALTIIDSAGNHVSGPQGVPEGHAGGGPTVLTRPITNAGERVGTAELRFRGRLTRAQSVLRSRITTAVLIGSAVAIVVALAGAALVTRALTRPLQRLTSAARRVRAGDLSARSAMPGAPGELGELSRAFDGMAQTLDDERQSRRRLVSDLAHEVRTPIAILQGNLEEMVDGVAEPTSERLGSLHDEILRLGTLVADLDMLALADAPVSKLDCAPVDLAALVRGQLDALRPQLDAKALRLDQALTPVIVVGDRTRLGQVVANLLSNAVKFTPEGGRITVEIGPSDGGARISVADTGAGIPPDEREHVLERFWRGSAAAGVSGRGIGLAVVSDVVHAHRGDIEVGDADGGGARITVTLPMS